MRNLSLMLRWSWRDLRANWIKVAAIALVIALGTGAYAGLTSSANWRRLSNEASYTLLNVHDLRVSLTEGSTAAPGDLAAAAGTIEHAEWIDDAEERYVVDVLAGVEAGGREIVVPGLLVGVGLEDGGPGVDRFFEDAGRSLSPADAGEDVVVLQHSFARYYDLPDRGTVTLGGSRELTYVGHTMQPEYFVVAPEGQLFFSEADYAVLFTSMQTAQRIGGTGGVNDLVLTLTEGADPAVVAREIEEAVDDRLGIGADVDPITEDPGYRGLTEDVDNDQQVFNLFAFLLIAGAVAGAFNLVNRLVEKQRREIGAAMALGARPGRIALRPLLVGAQIALLGVAFGILVGSAIGTAMRSAFTSLLPLPIWKTPFQPGVFAAAAVIGFVVPFAAAAWPVWRAVRVRPVEAIRPIHLTGGKRRKRRRFRRLRVPGSTFALMPFRNLARARRRTVTTTLAIAAVVTVLIGFLGLVDSLFATFDEAEAEALRAAPDRVVVDLDRFYPIGSEEIGEAASAPSVGTASPGARLGATVSSGNASFAVLVELIDFDDAVWTPTITAGSAPDGGLVLSEAAADDLGVGVGGTVMLRHPVRKADGSFALETGEMRVDALHPYPLRPFAYADAAAAGVFGVEGEANLLNVVPAPGADADNVKRDLLGTGSVVAAQPVASAVSGVRDQISFITDILRVIGVASFVLALLIAFNAASINLDERFRDHATMFAYGVPVRRALRMAMTESLVIGVAATAVGIAGGVAMIWWISGALLSETIPDLGVVVAIEPTTLLVAIVLGVAAVALAPLFTVRRMRRMDLPGTLRLME